MLILGEIADKMPSIPEVWLTQGILSLTLLLLVIWHRWLSLAATPICIWWIWITYSYLHGTDSDDIQYEMSAAWINHSFGSSFLPLIIVAFAFVMQFISIRKKNRSLRLDTFA